MSNIFQISEDLLAIFEELEDNDGELTPELEEQLTISSSQLDSKIKSYVHVIKQIESDNELVDKEIKRLQSLKKVKTNSIKRLKEMLAFAIDKFGETNKSGNKYYDYGTGKITVRNTQSVEVDEDTMQATIDAYLKKLQFSAYLNELSSLDEISADDVIDFIKTRVDDDGNPNGIDITKTEVDNIAVEVSFDIPLSKLLSGNGFSIAKTLMLDGNKTKYKALANKTMLKDVLLDNPESIEHIAKLNNNKTVIIK